MTWRYGKLPAWMFHGVIYNGKKAFGTFWEKNYGTIDSEKYNGRILSNAEDLFRSESSNGVWPVFMHNNATCQRSIKTMKNISSRDIPVLSFPPYSSDLNLIEHVWGKIKSYIQERHYLTGYDPQRIGFERLRELINEARQSIPDNFVSSLYDSWYDFCQAVIDARGGPTKY